MAFLGSAKAEYLPVLVWNTNNCPAALIPDTKNAIDCKLVAMILLLDEVGDEEAEEDVEGAKGLRTGEPAGVLETGTAELLRNDVNAAASNDVGIGVGTVGTVGTVIGTAVGTAVGTTGTTAAGCELGVGNAVVTLGREQMGRNPSIMRILGSASREMASFDE